MSTIGTIVDLLSATPEAIDVVQRIIERIQNARPEDRAAVIAALEAGAQHTHDAAARAAERLAAARAAEPG